VITPTGSGRRHSEPVDWEERDVVLTPVVIVANS
jgi:hypothetical protein